MRNDFEKKSVDTYGGIWIRKKFRHSPVSELKKVSIVHCFVIVTLIAFLVTLPITGIDKVWVDTPVLKVFSIPFVYELFLIYGIIHMTIIAVIFRRFIKFRIDYDAAKITEKAKS